MFYGLEVSALKAEEREASGDFTVIDALPMTHRIWGMIWGCWSNNETYTGILLQSQTWRRGRSEISAFWKLHKPAVSKALYGVM